MDTESLMSSLVVQNIKSGLKKEQLGAWREFAGLHSDGLSKAINLSKVCPEDPKCQTQCNVSDCAAARSHRTLKSSRKELEITVSPGFPGCGVHSTWETMPVSTEQKVFSTLQDIVPIRITNKPVSAYNDIY